MRNMLSLLFVVLPLAAVGCGGTTKKDGTPAVKAPDKKTEAAPEPKKDAKAIDAKREDGKDTEVGKVVEKKSAEPWGTLKGRIVWGGAEVPKRGFTDVKKDHPDAAFCLAAGPVPEDNTTVVDPKSKGLKDVFVWLVAKDKKMAIHPSLATPTPPNVIIDQPVCSFVPHALAVREGQVLTVKNSATKLHNFKFGGNPEVNPGANQAIEPGKTWNITDLKADRFPISVECNVHPWMRGWIRVFDHPYYAVTDSQGKFEIKHAPAGSYQLMIWHSSGWLGGRKGKDGKPTDIPAGGQDLGDIPFPPPAS